MTEEQKNRIGSVARRVQDILTIGAAVPVALMVILFILDNQRVRSFVANYTQTTELRLELLKTQRMLVETQQTLKDMSDVVDRLSQDVELLQAAWAASTDPVFEFVKLPSAHSITDGRIGEIVIMRFQFKKFRDCSRPFTEVRFEDAAGNEFRFDDLSIVDPATGRGANTPVDVDVVQTLRTTAHIPDDRGVVPGLAFGWAVVGPYPECPRAPTEWSPRIPFRILE